MFEIGNSLREARVRRGLDFAQAELATKIRGKYLRALEEEQFDLLPAETYVKGFLRTYAEYLGLDGQLYVDEYNSRFVGGGDDARAARRAAPLAAARSAGTGRQRDGVVLVVLAAIAILTVIVISAWKAGGGKPTAPPATRARQTAAPHVAPALLDRDGRCGARRT